jgi:hypothetical protein
MIKKTLPYFMIAIILMVSSCKTKKETASANNNMIISGQIVQKESMNKRGEGEGFYELYFRASVQDYFIKFCESKVKRKELEPYLAEDEIRKMAEGITVEAKIVHNGNWDICDESMGIAQSRTGDYIVIYKIVK